MKDIIILSDEEDVELRDQIIDLVNQHYSEKAVILPGVIKRPK